MYIYCVYHAMSESPKQLSKCLKTAVKMSQNSCQNVSK